MLEFLGIFIGLGIGITLGVLAGTRFLVDYFVQPDLKHLDIRADYDENVSVPNLDGKPVPALYRGYIQYFPAWVTVPDFYRVTWMNHVLKTLWPHYNQAIGKMVLETAKPYTDDIIHQYPFVNAIDIEVIDFGTKPLRVGGVKVYNSRDDEVIMEAALYWGSNAKIRASARITVWGYGFYIPVEIDNIQMKATSRISLKPLVDTLPCMGAITMSLIDEPYFDFGLHLFKRFDWMVLPGLSQLVTWTINGVVGDLLQYPNSMSIDIMEGGGIPPPAIGLLQVKILNIDKVTEGGDLFSKVDPYIEVGVRERTQRTRTIWNNKHPDFQEVFNLILDDPDMQQLTFKLHDDDLGFNDPVIGICEYQLSDAKFIKKPKHRVALDLDLIYPPALKKAKRLVEKSSQRKKDDQQKAPEVKETGVDQQGRKQFKIPDGPVDEEAKTEAIQKKSKHKVGTLRCEVIYVPFKGARVHPSNRKADDDSEDYESHENNQASKTRATMRSLSKVTDDDKGILTITLTGCSNLQAPDGSVDPYIILKLEDPVTTKPEVQKSTSMVNEPNPHWNQKFDFALCSATSVLHIYVYDQKSKMQNIMHKVGHPIETVEKVFSGSKETRDELIGSLRLKVKDAVRNERIRDSWALQQTQKGDIHMTLDWIPISLDDIDERLDEPGDQNEIEKLKKKKEEEEQHKNRASLEHRKSLGERLHIKKPKDTETSATSPSGVSPASPYDIDGPVKNSVDHEKKTKFHIPFTKNH